MEQPAYLAWWVNTCMLADWLWIVCKSCQEISCILKLISPAEKSVNSNSGVLFSLTMITGWQLCVCVCVCLGISAIVEYHSHDELSVLQS